MKYCAYIFFLKFDTFVFSIINLKSKYWGKGLGIEAARAIIQYAFDNLHAAELFGGHNPYNVNSKKVLERLGFHHIGDEYYAPTGLYHPSYKCVSDRQI